MNREHSVFIDVSKAAAALCVSLYHFIGHADHTGKLIASTHWTLSVFTDLLWSTVFVFFVISAFAMSQHLENARYTLKSFHIFIGKRMIRIFFPYALCILGYVLLETGFSWHNHEPPDIHWRQLLSNLTFTADFTGEKWYNPVFWTLAIEMQFYLLIALAYPLFRWLVSQKLAALILLCFLAVPFLVPSNISVFRYLPMLGMGYALFLDQNKYISRISCLIAVGSCAVVNVYFFGWLAASVLALFCIMFLYIKTHNFFGRFADMTYSYYLFHGLSGGTFLYFTARYAHSTWIAVILILLAVLVSAMASWIVFRAIEQPSVKWSKKWIRYPD